jgi:uncharacterized protein with HEPN domain
MSQAEEIRLRHMLKAARKAISFIHGRSRADLDSDEMLALAVVRLVEILGEAAKQIPPATREQHPHIPWRQITGTRDGLRHGYFDVDLDIYLPNRHARYTTAGKRARTNFGTEGLLSLL